MVDILQHAHLGTGDHHRVYDNGEYVIKLPTAHTTISFSQAKRSVDFFRDHFGEFVPETYIERSALYPYIASQRKVDGIVLAEKFLHNMPSVEIVRQLELFTLRAIDIAKRKKVVFDIIGNPYNDTRSRDSLFMSTNFMIDTSSDVEKLVFVDTIASCKCISEGGALRHIRYHISKKRKKHIDEVLEKYISILNDIHDLQSY